ncbi:MAG: diguanylate cyclase [Gemmatimonadota bacterium]|nr:diguanylate cyclase [Gemmatimonadota bacterium]
MTGDAMTLDGGGNVPDTSTLCAALDVVDVGMALVGPDQRIQYANAAFAEFVAAPPDGLEGESIFEGASPCQALEQCRDRWEDAELLTVSGPSPAGSVVDVVVRPVTPGSEVRLVVVRRGLVRSMAGRHLPPGVVKDIQEFLTELTGHAADPSTLSAAPLSILMMGVEGLSELRARIGEEAVEDLLREVAQSLVLQKRKADIISRYADGQFLVIAPDTARYGAAMLAERIRNRVEGLEIEADGEPVPVRLATYTAEYRPQLDGSIRDAVRRASDAVSERSAERVG